MPSFDYYIAWHILLMLAGKEHMSMWGDGTFEWTIKLDKSYGSLYVLKANNYALSYACRGAVGTTP